jgi:hypothetical protein
VLRPRRDPGQAEPVRQLVGARQAGLDLELLLEEAPHVDAAERRHAVLGVVRPGLDAGLERGVLLRRQQPRAAALGPVAQAVHPVAAVAPEPGVKGRAADAARPRRRLDRHPAEHVGHAEQAHPGARVRLAPGAPPQLRRAPRVDFDDPHRSHPR